MVAAVAGRDCAMVSNPPAHRPLAMPCFKLAVATHELPLQHDFGRAGQLDHGAIHRVNNGTGDPISTGRTEADTHGNQERYG